MKNIEKEIKPGIKLHTIKTEKIYETILKLINMYIKKYVYRLVYYSAANKNCKFMRNML